MEEKWVVETWWDLGEMGEIGEERCFNAGLLLGGGGKWRGSGREMKAWIGRDSEFRTRNIDEDGGSVS